MTFDLAGLDAPPEPSLLLRTRHKTNRLDPYALEGCIIGILQVLFSDDEVELPSAYFPIRFNA